MKNITRLYFVSGAFFMYCFYGGFIMLKTFDNQAKDKLNRHKPSKNLWIQLIDPSQNELERISRNFLIPFSMLTMHETNKHGAMIAHHADLFAFTVELPLKTESAKAPFEAMKLSIIVIDSVLITICKAEHPVFECLEKIYPELSQDVNITGFAYRILEWVNRTFFESVDHINEAVDEVERRLQLSISNRQVFELLNNNKGYLNFIRALKHNSIALKELAHKRLFASDHKTDRQMADILIANHQAQKKVEIYNANLRNLMDAYSAAIENNLSLAVQYLTIFVTIAAIPMAVAGIYGMNTPLPFQDEPYALAVLAGLTVVISVGAIAFFKMRRYI